MQPHVPYRKQRRLIRSQQNCLGSKKILREMNFSRFLALEEEFIARIGPASGANRDEINEDYHFGAFTSRILYHFVWKGNNRSNQKMV
jgi:hypothetical protein